MHIDLSIIPKLLLDLKFVASELANSDFLTLNYAINTMF